MRQETKVVTTEHYYPEPGDEFFIKLHPHHSIVGVLGEFDQYHEWAQVFFNGGRDSGFTTLSLQSLYWCHDEKKWWYEGYNGHRPTGTLTKTSHKGKRNWTTCGVCKSPLGYGGIEWCEQCYRFNHNAFCFCPHQKGET